MEAAQITAASLYGNAGGTGGMAISPYGVGLGVAAPVGALVPAPRQAIQAGTFAPFDGVSIARDFWGSATVGLIILLLLIGYFDIRLLNR